MEKTYSISWSQQVRNGQTNGRDWAITEMTLKDEQGVETEKVSTFDKVMTGDTLVGKIVTNDKGYLNFVKKPPVSGAKPNMDRLMEKKSSQIAESQERKAQSIAQAQDRSAWMWAKTNASTILANRSGFATQTNGEIADQVLDLATQIYNGEPLTPFN